MTTTNAIDRIKEATGYLDTTNKEDFAHYSAALAAVKKWEDAAERQVEVTANRPGYAYDWDLLNTIVEADVALKFWDGVVASSSPSRDDLRITEGGVADQMKAAASSLLRNSGGTSTDPMSNARDAIERAFFSRLLTWSNELRDVTIGEVI